jgi:hypothetical protein
MPRKPRPTPEPTPTPTPSTNPSGQAMPNADLPGWRLIFSDDFNTNVPLGSFPSAVSSKWWAYPTSYMDTVKQGRYDPAKTISCHDSMLDMFIHTENSEPKVAAPFPRISSATGLYGEPAGQLYGRYAVRFKSDPLPGYKTAWLLWPDSGVWPRDGEIDFPEGDLKAGAQIMGFMHRQGATSGSDQEYWNSGKTYDTWHTAIIEWAPTYCWFLLDDFASPMFTSRVPNTPMHWVLQTETDLNTADRPDPTTAGHVYIDWVAVWAKV